jgi:hypothetical protein
LIARATLADVARNLEASLTALIERCEATSTVLEERDAGDALAEQVGGPLALRWRLAVLHALIADPPDGDAVREAYGEIVDRYRGDTSSLAVIKPLGDEIRRRESEGSLPSVLVARSDRRPKTHQG